MNQKTTQLIAQEIINDYCKGVKCEQLSHKYHLSVSTINDIIGGRKWANCYRPIEIIEKIKYQNKWAKSAKITQETAQEIIDKYCAGQSCPNLAKEYNLWHTSICNLIAGRTWKDCKRPDNIKELIQQQKETGHYKIGEIKHIDAPPLTEIQKEILIGSMLGDGSISKPKPNSSFTKTQSLKRKEYLEWHVEMLKPYSVDKLDENFSKEILIGGKNGVIAERIPSEKRLSGYAMRTHVHPELTKIRNEWYPNGTKIVPIDLVLTPQSIAIWYFDDGSNCVKSRTAVLCTQCFTLDEADLLCQKLSNFNLTPKIVKIKSQYTGREMPMLKFTKESYDNLINLIKPFCLWECFQYKVKWRPRLRQWEYGSGKLTPDDVEMIKILRGNLTAKEIALKFDVHINTIFAIVSGRRRNAI